MHRHRLVHLVYWSCVVLLAGGILPFGAPVVLAAPAAQIAPGSGYVPRPATIRRLPGGRVLRIVSRTHGGMMNRVCTLATVGESRIGLRTSGLGEEGLPAPVIFLPGSGQLASEINMPVVCVLAGEEPVIATALAPDGETRLPALVVPEGRLSIVSLPIETFMTPGEWQLEITAPVERVYPITVPPLARPALVVSGEALLLEGYTPGEALRGVVLANRCTTEFVPLSDPPEPLEPLSAAESELCALGEVSALLDAVQVFDAVADARGAAFVQRIDPEQNLTYAMLGATTPQLLSTLAFSADLEQAIAESGFPVERRVLFAEDDPAVVDPVVDPVVDKTPAPPVLPETGAELAGGGAARLAFGVAIVLIVLAGAARLRAQPRRKT